MSKTYDTYKDSGISWIGYIPNNWKISKMKHIGTYINGYAFKPSDWNNEGKPIIRIQDLTGSQSNPNYYNGELDEKYLVKAGDILVSWAATLDAFIWSRKEGWLNQHIFKAIPNTNIVCKDFFFWLVKVAMSEMNNDNKHGIVMQHVTTGVFNIFKIPLPPLTEQEEISCVLNKKCSEIEELISEFEGSKAYELDASNDDAVKTLFEELHTEYGQIDGILHCIAHAFTDDLKNDFINTSKEGFAHANDVSAYTIVSVTRFAKETGLIGEGGSVVALTYHGSTKVLPGYNVMGVAKAALEASIRYLADNIGPMGIRINAVSAGPIKTLSARGIKDFSTIQDVMGEKAPLRRNVTAHEVGDAVSFLFSNMSSAITGQIVYADAGYSIMGI